MSSRTRKRNTRAIETTWLNRLHTRQLFIERLESRRVFAGVPSVAIGAPVEVMIGESLSVQVAFDNTHASDPGYGPFVDIYLPRNGADGVSGAGIDGLSYIAGSANYLGAPITTTVLVIPDLGGGVGSVVHPYAVDTNNSPLVVSGDAGDQLLVFQLPFGSFTASQPAASIDFNLQPSNLADLATPLNIRARGGFQFGGTPLNDPATDPTIVSQPNNATVWTPIAPVTPTLVRLTKSYLGPEDETGTGPNFPRQYRIDVDIANGQTITSADVIDLLPNNIQLVSVNTITPGSGNVTNFPTTPANALNNQLIVSFPSLIGTAATTDASVLFTYFVPFRDADGNQIISPISGNDATAPNNASFVGDWDPIDPRDPNGTNNVAVDAAGPEHTLIPKSIATQKSVALINDIGGAGYSGGDTVEYTIQFQISDYFAFDNLTINDVISDGQRFDAGFAPTLSITEHGFVSSGVMALANVATTDHFTGGSPAVAPLSGTQEIDFAISDELVARGRDAILVGGLLPLVGTSGADPNPATFNQGATTGTLRFRAIVQESFSDNFPSGDQSVDEGDLLTNDVTIDGRVLRYTDLVPQQTESDLSSANFSIVEGTLAKSIYAINGNTALPAPLRISPGDTITYRIQLSIPSSDVEDLRLDDYLPLPVLLANEVTTFADVVSASSPAAGTAKFGPNDTFRARYGSAPSLSTDTVSNRVSFEYGDFDQNPSVSSNIDILFTVTATSTPFADGLFLTNQVRRYQASTNAGSVTEDAIVQIQLGEPALQIRKGVVVTSNPVDDIFAPTTVGPVSFSAPGSAGFRSSSTINSSGLLATPINSNVSGIDAGDLVTFAIVVENTGSSRHGAFDVRLRDSMPAGFAIPSGGLNMNVSDGTGATLPFSTIGTGLFDVAGGISIDDPGATPASVDGTNGGALDEYDPADGRNILIVTYDLVLQSTVTPLQTLTNTARLFNYASVEGGVDFTTEDPTDDAIVQVAQPSANKTVVTTNQTFTAGVDVAVGEIVTYQSVLTIQEGATPNLTWTDTPDAGLAIIDIVSLTPSSSDLTASGGTFATIQAGATIPASGSSANLNFGNITNSNLDNSVDETITIVYRAIVLNNASTNRGTLLRNQASLTYTGGSRTVVGPDVTVVEPSIAITKTITPATGQGSEVFTVTIDVANTGSSNADAFNLNLSDVLPTGFTYVGGAPTSTGLAPNTLSESAGTIAATWDSFPLASVSQIRFTVQTLPTLISGSVISNTANQTWTSLPGDVTSAQSTNPLSTERTGNTANPGGAVNDYRSTSSDTVTIGSPVVTKTLITTNQAHTLNANVAIGEIATYEVVLNIPQSSMPTTRFVDTPDGGLSIVDVLSVTASPSITTSIGTFADVSTNAVIGADGSSLTFAFGTLSNTDTNTATTESIVIRYRAVVLNSANNNRGNVVDNAGVLTWGTSGSVIVDGSDLTIVEPDLSIVVSNGTPTPVDAGDTVTFTIDVAHTGASNADAFNVDLQNLINSAANHLQYLPGSLAISNLGGAVSGTNSVAGGDLNLAWTSFPTTASSRVTFSAIVQNSAPASTVLTDTGSLRWTSLPGNVTTAQSTNSLSVERTGNTSDIGATANDHSSNDNGTVTTRPPTSGKSIVATSLPQTGTSQFNATRTDLAVGELVTYAINVVLPEGTNTLVITDQLPFAPGVLEYVSARVNSVGSQLTIGAPTIVESNTNADGFNDRVVFNFGSLVNTPDGVSSNNDVVEVHIVARVVDVAGNSNSTVLTNTATIDVSGVPNTVSAEVEIVEPQLLIDKVATVATELPGNIVPYTVSIQHAPGSTASAFDIAIADLLADPNLDLVPGTVTTSRGSITSGNGANDTTVGISLAELAIGQTILIGFSARIHPSTVAFATIPNTADLSYDTLPGAGGRSTTDSDTEIVTTLPPLVDLQLRKTISQSPTVINTPLQYTIVVTNNGPSTAMTVSLTDDLPAGLTNVSATTTRGTVNVAFPTITGNLGALLPGQSATILVSATTPSVATTIVNRASVNSPESDSNSFNNSDTVSTVVQDVSSIAGRSWVDTDRDGVVDTGEVLLPGVLITLTGVSDLGASVTRTTTTDSSGNYRFTLLRPGNYRIRQTQPSLFIDSNEFIGSAGGTRSSNDSIDVVLAAGVNATNYLFTELGLRSNLLSKRSLLNSRLRQGNPVTFDAFYGILGARGLADLDGDGDVDSTDFNLFQNRLGGQFNI